MRPLDYPLLADENIHADAVAAMVGQGRDVRTVQDEGLVGRDDVEVIRRAHALGRVVVTHDADFGKLAMQAGEPFIGIIYLRPGHIAVSFVLGVLAAVETVGDVAPGFIVVAERREDTVRVRLRSGGG